MKPSDYIQEAVTLLEAARAGLCSQFKACPEHAAECAIIQAANELTDTLGDLRGAHKAALDRELNEPSERVRRQMVNHGERE